MDYASLDNENPNEEVIDIDDNSIFPEIPDAEDAEVDSEDDVDLGFLNSDLKIDIIKADGTVVPGSIINKTPDEPELQVLGVPDTNTGDIENTPEGNPSISGAPESFLVQKRILGTKHAESRGKYSLLYLGQQQHNFNELIMRLNDLNTEQTRFGKYIAAPSRKNFNKEQIKALRDAKQLQRELNFEADPTYDEEVEEELQDDPTLRGILKKGNKLKLSKVHTVSTRSSRFKVTKYKELALSNSISVPVPIQEDLPYTAPKYTPITLENSLIKDYNETEGEFKFRNFWTQIALQIGSGNLSIATSISLGKMKTQKIKYGVAFDPEIEKLINSVDDVYILNSELLQI
jgi:hypothetical protein